MSLGPLYAGKHSTIANFLTSLQSICTTESTPLCASYFKLAIRQILENACPHCFAADCCNVLRKMSTNNKCRWVKKIVRDRVNEKMSVGRWPKEE